MDSSSGDSTSHGSCLCGAVTFQIDGEAKLSIICHCENCQRSSGCPFAANLILSKSQFTLLSGSEVITGYNDSNTESGATLVRSFCSKCGSPVCATNETNPAIKDNIIVSVGSLDAASKARYVPQRQIYCKDRHDWVKTTVETKDSKGMI